MLPSQERAYTRTLFPNKIINLQNLNYWWPSKARLYTGHVWRSFQLAVLLDFNKLWPSHFEGRMVGLRSHSYSCGLVFSFQPKAPKCSFLDRGEKWFIKKGLSLRKHPKSTIPTSNSCWKWNSKLATKSFAKHAWSPFICCGAIERTLCALGKEESQIWHGSYVEKCPQLLRKKNPRKSRVGEQMVLLGMPISALKELP